MADGAAGPIRPLYHTPGNPQLPTLPTPGDPQEALVDFFVNGAGITQGRPPATKYLETRGAGPDTSRGFAGTWLNKVGVDAQLLDYGSITAAKQRQITIHNTNRFSIDVTAIDLTALTGITVVTPGLPVTVDSHDSVVIVFEASLIGPASFDDIALITTSENVLRVRMVGRRVIIFNARPQRPITERISFMTDNMIAVSGKEQAFSLRVAPRSMVTVDQRITDDVQRARLVHQLLAVSYLRCGVQLWYQSREVDAIINTTDTVVMVDTENMEIDIDGLVSLVSPDYETVIEVEVVSFTISSITLSQEVGTAFPLGTSVMPLKFGFAKNKVKQAAFPVAAEDVRVSIDLIEYENIGALDLAYFDTHPVDGRPIITHDLFFDGQTLSHDITNRIAKLDSNTGDINAWQPELLGRPGQQVLVHCTSMADQHAWRRFLHFVRGSWAAFYIPTGQNDLPLRDPLTLGGSAIVIDNLGLATLIGTQAPRRDVEVLIAGVRYFRQIVSVVDGGAFETITLDAVIPGAGLVPAADVRVSWLTLSRIVGDTASFKHLRRGRSELRFRVRGVIE